jgi:TolB-like protein
MSESSFFAELQRRNVLRAGAFYAASAWLLVQIATQVFPFFHIAEWVVRWIVVAAAIGFPFALAFAWFYEFTPQGLKRESDVALDESITRRTGKTLDRWIIAVLTLAVVLLLANTFVLHKEAGDAIARVAPAKSVAVLPFENLSGDPKNAYFSDGITEEILNALTQVPDLKVAGRTSAFRFNGRNEDLRKVGETLGVATVLEGSVQRSQDQVRITAQLVDAHSGYQLWSEKYDRKLTNIFAVEDEISNAIADKLQVQLAGARQASVRSRTDDPQAHALYLQGIAKIAQRGPALEDAVTLLEQATVRDPGYAAAWAGLSQADELLPWYNLGDWRPSLAKAESAAQRALALDPQLGEAHAAMANVLRDRVNFAGAMREYHLALALNPGSPETHNQYAQLLQAVGVFDESIAHERIATSLDPLAPSPRSNLGWDLLAMHRYPQAIAEFQKLLDQTPGYTYARFNLAFAHLHAGDYPEAEEAARTGALQLGQDPSNLEALIRAVADPALRPDALERVAQVHQIGVVELGGLARAFWYCLLGAHEQAIDSLQHWGMRGEPDQQYNGIIYLWMPAFDLIRDDPRFQAVLKKMGMPYTPPAAAAP